MTKMATIIDGFARAYPMFIVLYSFMNGLLNNNEDNLLFGFFLLGGDVLNNILKRGVFRPLMGNKNFPFSIQKGGSSFSSRTCSRGSCGEIMGAKIARIAGAANTPMALTAGRSCTLRCVPRVRIRWKRDYLAIWEGSAGA